MAHSTQMIEELDDCFVKTAGNIIKYYADEDERSKILKDVREVFKLNCIETARIKVADEIREELECISSQSSIEPEMEVEELTKKYKKAISEIKIDPSKDSRLLKYDSQTKELLQANQVTSNNGADDTDMDLQLTSSDINVIDPITKTRMTDPVKNTVCGHVYDRGSLIAMLEKNKHTRCPVIGCTSTDYIVLSQCRIDIVTKTYLERNPA